MKKFSKFVIVSIGLMWMGFSSAFNSEAAVVETNAQKEQSAKVEFSGVDDITIPLGEQFNPFKGVSLVSSNGKVSSEAKILVSNNEVNVHKVGLYKLTYVAFDGCGGYFFKERKIIVKALTNNKPQLNVTGQVIFKGMSFNPLNYATAWDKEDGEISQNIKMNGSVNTSVSGLYFVNYSITDSAGNTETKTINFYVM